MPMINTFETDKFHAITTRLHSKQKKDKQTIAEDSHTDAVKPTPIPSTSNQKFITGATIPNSTIRRGSVLKLDSHMQTKSGDHIYLSSSINPKIDLDVPPSNKNPYYDTSSSSIALQTSGEKLQELKAMHQHLVNLSQAEPNKPVYEPRRPTMESIKRAIERAKKEEIERHKSTGTEDLISSFPPLSASVSDAVTCTETQIVKKPAKKVKKLKASTHSGVLRTKKKSKKVEPKVRPVSMKKKDSNV